MLLLVLPLSSYAATYFVTPSGGGNHSGTSLGNAFSLSDFNSGKGAGGDTLNFSGTFTSTVAPARSGSSNSARITLNMSGATLVSASTRIQLSALSYLNIVGGSCGSSYDGVMVNFNPNNGGISHDITVSNWTYTGQANGVGLFLSLNHVYNLVVSNCTVENVGSFIVGDSTLNHDINITGCYAGGSTDVTAQDDLIHIGDAANVTIEKCKLIGRAPASPSGGRHNDIVQNYTKGGSYPGSPTNWIIRYNWFELQQRSGSGDCSWLMFQSMGGNPALKLYGNVFVGTGTVGDNGVCISRNNGGVYYCYNNTFVRHGNPGNDIRFMDSGILYSRNNVGQSDVPVGNFATWTMGNGGWDYNFFLNAPTSGAYSGSHGSQSTNPLFANFGGNVFSLLTNSPLRGRGDRSIGTEFATGIKAGSTWPNPALTPRNTWDIGAFNQ